MASGSRPFKTPHLTKDDEESDKESLVNINFNSSINFNFGDSVHEAFKNTIIIQIPWIKLMNDVLKFLDIHDLRKCRLVNSTWNAVASDILKKKTAQRLGINDVNPSIVLQNTLVLSSVFKFLEVKELQACRLMNSTWNQEASEWIRKKSVGIRTAPEAMQNRLVLHNIFQYLTVKELKEVRQVSKIWKPEASIWLKRKTFVTLGVKVRGLCPITGAPRFRSKLKSYNMTMRHFPTQNIKIRLRAIAKAVACSRPPENERIFPRLVRMMERIGPGLRLVEVGFLEPLSCSLDATILQKIFNSTDNLNVLKLKICCDEKTEQIWKNFPIIEGLKTVKELHLKVFPGYSNEHRRYFKIISDKMFNLFPGVTVVIFETAPRLFLREFWSRWKCRVKLTQLCLPLEVASMDLVQQISDRSHFMGNLTHLGITLPSVDDPKEIQNLFNRVAPTLKEFSFMIQSVRRSRSNLHREPVVIVMPVFPRLKKLFVTHSGGDICNRWSAERNTNLRFSFQNNQLNYSVLFPELKSLTLGHQKFCEPAGAVWHFYEAFIPKVEVVPWISELNVPLLDSNNQINQRITGVNLFPLAIMSRIATSFPALQNDEHLIQSVARLRKVRRYLATLAKVAALAPAPQGMFEINGA